MRTMKTKPTPIELPEVPFSIYFLNSNQEVSPKKMFTVTHKSEDGASVYILELEKEMVYDYHTMDVVSGVWPN